MFVGIAIHFLLKPFAAATFGSGPTAAAYLNSRYAMISQTATGLMLIAVGLVLLMNVLQTVISFNRAEARTDALTGLPNRRALYEEFIRTRSERGGKALVFVLVDIDRFKAINDRHGHAVGDEVLRGVAHCLSTHKPTDALVARVGGEEFALLLPQEPSVALMSTETLRLAVSQLTISDVAVTISAGMTSVLPDEDLSDTFRRADRGLYKAKVAGRDRTVVEAPEKLDQRPPLRLLRS
jgi:diguanylate cyclase (GGDEF)-like protein